MSITLTVTAGPHIGRCFTFQGHDAFLVGRSKHAHFRLPRHDRFFSRIHFLVEVNPPRCCLIDMGSTNGTRINGRLAKSGQAIELANGDRIEGGHTVLYVSIIADDASALAPRPEEEVRQSMADYRPVITAQLIAVGQRCIACAAAPIAGEGLCSACSEAAKGRPQPIADYRLIREIGRGGMGIVYLAIHRPSRSRVGLKTITPALAAPPEQIRRFLREAGILCRIQHPHIIRFFDIGASAEQLYFAMEYVAGVDAEILLKRHGPLPIGPTVRLMCQLLEALEYAHGQGFVHRDIKPSNLLIEEAAGRASLRLADFGLARVYAASQMSGLTLAGDIGGTVAFMPPEQITHFRDARPPADLYSTAATLYNLLTGRFIHDFPPAMHDRLEMILATEAVPIRRRRKDIPRRLAEIIHRALAKTPSARFASARAMRQALTAFASPADQPLIPSPGTIA
jgi:serine/threonine-protein kinase